MSSPTTIAGMICGLTFAMTGPLASQVTSRRPPPAGVPATAPPAPLAGAAVDPNSLGDATPPSNLTASDTNTTSLTLTWSAVAGASGYLVSRAENPGAAGARYQVITPTPITVTQYIDDGDLLPATTYGYTVTAVRPDGHFGVSAPVTVRTGPPVNPGNFAAAVRGSDVELSWQPVPGASFYWLQGSGLPARNVSENRLTVSGLPPGVHSFALMTRYGREGQVADEANPARVSVTLQATRGRYRITINGLKVTQETSDDPLQGDGRGDEVYVATLVRTLDRKNGQLISDQAVRSDVHGDVSREPGRRVQAGRASDTGGILRGDVVPYVTNPAVREAPPSHNALPLHIWEGELVDGQTLVLITPTIWEYDGDSRGYDYWVSTTRRSYTPQLWGNDLKNQIAATSLAPFALKEQYGPLAEEGPDRPIGVRPSDRDGTLRLQEQSVAVTREAVEKALAAPATVDLVPKGGIAIPFDDAPGRLGMLGGHYTLYVQVERVP